MMNLTNKLFLGLALFTLAGCSQRSAKNAAVAVTIPSLSGLVASSAPSHINEFDCVALNVTGPGIESQQSLGLVSSVVAASTGGTLNIQVPIGKDRLFQVVGIETTSGSCPATVSREQLSSVQDYPILAEVGRITSDIDGDTKLIINGSYSVSSATDIRTGQAIADSGGSNPPGNGGGGGGGGGTPPGNGGGGGGSNPAPVGCEKHVALFSGGTGAQSDPFIITTTAQWNAIGYEPERMKCHYKLDDDLDFSGVTIQQIGRYGQSSLEGFSGSFDGGGKIISNGTVPLVAESYNVRSSGLFGLVTGQNSSTRAVIKNLIITNFTVADPTANMDYYYLSILINRIQYAHVENVEISNSRINVTTAPINSAVLYAGGVIGKITSGASFYMKNISVMGFDVGIALGSTASTMVYCGGIAGMNDTNASANSVFDNSRVYDFSVVKTGKGTTFCGGLFGQTNTPLVGNLVQEFTYQAADTVAGVNHVGGLIGSTNSTVSKSAAIDLNIQVVNQGNNSVGGLVGTGRDANVKIDNSYATGSVDGYDLAGGVIGALNSVTSGDAITNVYLDLKVVNAGLGGQRRKYVVGYLPSGTATAVSTYYSTTIQDTPYTAEVGISGVLGKTAAELIDESTFVGWDFTPSTGIWFQPYMDSPPRLRINHDLIYNAG